MAELIPTTCSDRPTTVLRSRAPRQAASSGTPAVQPIMSACRLLAIARIGTSSVARQQGDGIKPTTLGNWVPLIDASSPIRGLRGHAL